MKRNDNRYKNFRKAVLERDGFRCQLCGEDDTIFLDVHHIIKYSDNEELRTDINNGITLCKKCHQQIFGKEEIYEKIFKEILENPIWKYEQHKEVIKDIYYRNYIDLNKDCNVDKTLLVNSMFKYIEDVSAFKIYCYLCSKIDYDKGYAFPSLSTIAQDCCMSIKTVQNAVKYLEERRFVVKFKAKGKEWMNNCYYVNYVVETEEDKMKEKELVMKEIREKVMEESMDFEIEIFYDEDGKIIKEEKNINNESKDK